MSRTFINYSVLLNYFKNNQKLKLNICSNRNFEDNDLRNFGISLQNFTVLNSISLNFEW